MGRLDLRDPELYRSGVPYDYFRRLRDHEPVAWHDEPDGSGYWVLTRYDDVVAANRNWQRYSNELRGSSIEDPTSDEELASRRLIFVNQDPPRHTRMRKLVSPAFTPGRVRRLVPQIERACTELVGRLCDGGVHDLVSVGEELAFQMVATMFGVPRDDWPTVIDWTRRITNFQEPELNEGLLPRHLIQREALAYARDLIAEARRHPSTSTGILADLVDSQICEDGRIDRLSDDELATFFLVVVVGGVETTSHALVETVNAMVEQPGLLDELVADVQCPPAVVEEMIRWRGPVMNFRRTATEDHQLRGVPIRAGDKVLLVFASANRDERHFDDPDRFDPRRRPNDHVGFGSGGPHFCIGAQLARLDLRLVLGELLRRVEHFEPAGPAVRLRSNQFAGWLHFPVHACPRA